MATQIKAGKSLLTAKTDLQGLDEIFKEFKKMEEKAHRKILLKAVRKAARILRKRAKENAPVDTGTLKKSIAIKTLKKIENHLASVIVGARHGINEKDDGWYAHILEFGSVKMPAQPFLEPAFYQTEKQMWLEMERELQKILFS